MSTGIRKRHSQECPGRDGGRSACNAGWEASVFSKRDGKKIRKTFPTKAAAKTWRDDASPHSPRVDSAHLSHHPPRGVGCLA